jgi:hypothetical protein
MILNDSVILALPLLVLRLKFIDNVKPGFATTATTFAPNELVVRADFFDTCTHFHADHAPSSDDSLLILMMS